ncbi:S49 family peptidase [Emticicia sp. W12TSBA100-4]|uniref:S49 family peptidase n=1 Tax=Emticicia sp. W12TSBA100-4 TaxID=3160965 RepID=UPI003305CEF2
MNTNNQLFLSLSTEPLAIMPGYLESFLFNIENGVESKIATQNFWVSQATSSNGGKIMIIQIQGVIMADSYAEYGIMGMKDLQKLLETAKNDSEISGVILHIKKSPGGSMNMVAETADMIYAFPKPIETYAEELVASSAYYLAAATDKITVSARSTIVGNVGSKVVTMFTEGIWEKAGAKYVEVYGTKAVNKDIGFTEAKAGKPEKLRQILINPANDMFINDVLKYRPKLKESQLDGMIWYSEDAVKQNYADATGSLQDVINGFNFSNNNVNNQMEKVTLTFEKGTVGYSIAKAFAINDASPEAANPEATVEPVAPVAATPSPEPAAPVAATPATPEPNSIEARLEALEAKITEKDIAIATLTTQLVAAKTVNPAVGRTTQQQQGLDPKAGKDASDIPDWRQTDAELYEKYGHTMTVEESDK